MIRAPEAHGAGRGRLVYVMGPSGAGKDTLLDYARTRVDPARILFAHRYITRPASAGGENHVALTAKEFTERRAAGLFALSWCSHGYSYGVGREIELWMERGFTVVVSGSRAAWSEAAGRYPELSGIVITAPEEVRAARLALRGREQQLAVVAERLGRDVSLPADGGIVRLDNSGPVEIAGQSLVRLLVTGAGGPPTEQGLGR